MVFVRPSNEKGQLKPINAHNFQQFYMIKDTGVFYVCDVYQLMFLPCMT